MPDPGRLYMQRGDGWVELGTTTDAPIWSAVFRDEAIERAERFLAGFTQATATLRFTSSAVQIRKMMAALRARGYARPLCINGHEYHRRQRARRRR